jgi:hypothetical protein
MTRRRERRAEAGRKFSAPGRDSSFSHLYANRGAGEDVGFAIEMKPRG